MRKSFVLRLDDNVFATLKSRAAQLETSINSYCVSLIDQKLSTTDLKNSDPLVQKIEKYFGNSLLGVALFGSVARGTQKKTSDIDILIVLRPEIEIKGKLYRDWDKAIESYVGIEVSPHFVHLLKDLKNAGSLWLEVALEAKVLFDPQGELSKTLGDLRVLIAEGFFQRNYSYGIPYWKKTL